MSDLELGEGAVELLLDGLDDDVSMAWVLIHLGLMDNPSSKLMPTLEDIEQAFTCLANLRECGLIFVGRTAPSRFRSHGAASDGEPVDVVRQHVLDALAGPDPDRYAWTVACWVVNTELGDTLARRYRDDEDGPAN